MKQITIAGNIGKDAELRSTQNGDQVAGFGVGVEVRSGREKSTVWFDVSIWGKRAEALSPYLTKGTRVCVCGDLGTREHNGKTYLTVKADQVTLLGGGKAREDQGGAPAGGFGGGMPGNDLDSDIPFGPWVL
jgi:single-strand DNA-binding protein